MCRAFSLALSPIPFPAFPIPVPGVSQSRLRPFSSDGSGSACFAIPPRPLSNPAPAFPQSRSRRFSIPFPAFPNPAPAFPNPVPGVSQSHLRPFSSDGSGSACFAIPPRPLSNPAPAFRSDGSGSACFYRCAPAAALPQSRPGFSPSRIPLLSVPAAALSQSRPGRFPIPPRLFPNPVPGVSQSHLRPFSSDGSGSASFAIPPRLFPNPVPGVSQSRPGFQI